MKKQSSLILSLCILPFCLSACGGNNISNDDTKPEEQENVPETGKADRSDLKYLSELDSYKKADWKGHWIWASNCY